VPILSRVLAKRREHDAVLQGSAAQLQWPEELRHAACLAIGDKSGAGWRILEGSEIWHRRAGAVGQARLFLDVGGDVVVGGHFGWCVGGVTAGEWWFGERWDEG